MRGVARRRRRARDYSRAARVAIPGEPGSARPDAPGGCAMRHSGAPRGIAPLIAFTAAGPAGPYYPGRLLPGWPPEVVAGVSLNLATLTGAASRPTLITPHDGALAWTGPSEYGAGAPRVQAFVFYKRSQCRGVINKIIDQSQ